MNNWLHDRIVAQWLRISLNHYDILFTIFNMKAQQNGSYVSTTLVGSTYLDEKSLVSILDKNIFE